MPTETTTVATTGKESLGLVLILEALETNLAIREILMTIREILMNIREIFQRRTATAIATKVKPNNILLLATAAWHLLILLRGPLKEISCTKNKNEQK